MLKYLVLISILLCSSLLRAQDSSVQLPPDTSQQVVKPVVKKHFPKKPVVKKDSTATVDSMNRFRTTGFLTPGIIVDADSLRNLYHPFYRFTDPVRYSVTIKQWRGKEAVFYSIMALLIIFALIKNGFNRYIRDLVKIFFRTTAKQRQIREQLMESPLPSLMLNGFFLLSTGMFLALLLQYFKLGLQFNFWALFSYCVVGLLAIYTVKFISLKFLGWIFQVSDAIDSYVFVVFSTNKIIGIALLPFVVVLAFSHGMLNEMAMSLSIFVVLALYAYRFFLSYVSIHRQVQMSFFHFFLYLMAFELAPLLLINKLLFRLLGETY
ncbi:MAG: DUF4271 domain-containing protein [Flavisolibacter sp.]